MRIPSVHATGHGLRRLRYSMRRGLGLGLDESWSALFCNPSGTCRSCHRRATSLPASPRTAIEVTECGLHMLSYHVGKSYSC
jgi:hypothetical protein